MVCIQPFAFAVDFKISADRYQVQRRDWWNAKRIVKAI